ncbi:hypothetical protein RI056_12290 [Komagataeibacter nataicola]|uniref:hypothetical protein n=1 Tax=Komagataeibacter nataicola TaxID=265960 RepID=UPI0028B1E258|nr:hypothetical protein [Komagataeibacter nataicola]WNM10217.1 hypothetical protein RI056_12290 [Komagataeibacter nataicola]
MAILEMVISNAFRADTFSEKVESDSVSGGRLGAGAAAGGRQAALQDGPQGLLREEG